MKKLIGWIFLALILSGCANMAWAEGAVDNPRGLYLLWGLPFGCTSETARERAEENGYEIEGYGSGKIFFALKSDNESSERWRFWFHDEEGLSDILCEILETVYTRLHK